MPPKRKPNKNIGKVPKPHLVSRSSKNKLATQAAATDSTTADSESSHNDSVTVAAEEEYDCKFAKEMLWCVQKLEAVQKLKKTTSKQAEELRKTIASLLSKKTALVKKRQLMRMHCGDYRAKMATEDATNAARKRTRNLPKFKSQPKVPSQSKCFRKTVSNISGATVTDDGAVATTFGNLVLDADREEQGTGEEQRMSEIVDGKHTNISNVENMFAGDTKEKNENTDVAVNAKNPMVNVDASEKENKIGGENNTVAIVGEENEVNDVSLFNGQSDVAKLFQGKSDAAFRFNFSVEDRT